MNIDVIVMLANFLLGCAIISCAFLVAFVVTGVWEIITKIRTLISHKEGS